MSRTKGAKNKEKIKNRIIQIRVTEEEYNFLTVYPNMSEYIRMLIRNKM